MSEAKSASRLHIILASEVSLGVLIVVLAISAATTSYLSAMSDSDQTKYNVAASQKLATANSELLTANQQMSMDYNNYDAFYLNQDKPDVADYYTYNFSEELTAGIERSKADTLEDADPFDEPYYDAMAAGYELTFKEAKELYALAEKFNTRGDDYQLIILIASMGLAFAAFAALLPEDSKLRVTLAILSIGLLIYVIFLWLQIPVAGPTLTMEIRPD